MPTWFEYVKPHLGKDTMQQASVNFFRTYYPDLYSAAERIADETMAGAGRLVFPDCGVPDDLPQGLILVLGIIESKLLG